MSEKKDNQLTPEQVRAINALAAGATYVEAARAAGRSVRTLQAWRANNLAFQEALSGIDGKILDETAHRLISASLDAVECLCDVTRDKKIPPSVRVNAAKAILELSLKLRDNLTYEALLTELEAQLRLKT